jgi:hypothetical protein
MALGHNPSIVTSGLIACFDPANLRTYSGSGTTIYDCSGNGYTGTLVNGATYTSSNGGVFVTDGVNDYIDIPINLATTNYTVIGAARWTGGANGRTFSAKNNNWLMGHWGGTTLNHYAEGWVTSSGGTGAADTTWRIYAATGNISGDSYNFYVNGILNTGPSTGGSAGPNGFAIGSIGGTSEFSAAQIGFMLVYNTVLTAEQILQNFNALRGRYGI